MRKRFPAWILAILRWAGGIAWMGSLLAWVLRHWGDKAPMARLLESEHLQAFHHPQPAYALHIVIVPKKAVRSLLTDGVNIEVILQDLVRVVRQLVARFGLEKKGYRLIVNGGPYQEIPQLHFHLVSSGED